MTYTLYLAEDRLVNAFVRVSIHYCMRCRSNPLLRPREILLFETGMLSVFFRSFILTIQLRPVHSDGRVIPRNTAFSAWIIHIGAFVDELCCIGENEESMRKASRDIKQVFLLGAECYAHPLTVSRTSRPHIHSNIEHFTVRHSDQFPLRVCLLEMETTQDSFCTLKPRLAASAPRLSTGCFPGFTMSGVPPDYTIHTEPAHPLQLLYHFSAKCSIYAFFQTWKQTLISEQMLVSDDLYLWKVDYGLDFSLYGKGLCLLDLYRSCSME